MFNINVFHIWLFLFLFNSIICILRAHKTTPSDKLLAPVVNHGGSETKPGERAREPAFEMLTSSVSRRASTEAMKSFYACQRPWRTWLRDRGRRWQDKFIRLHIWVIASLEKCNTSSFGLLPSRGRGWWGWRDGLAWFGTCAAQKGHSESTFKDWQEGWGQACALFFIQEEAWLDWITKANFLAS